MKKLTVGDYAVIAVAIVIFVTLSPTFRYFASFIIGIAAGRIYGWMKYRNPEFREIVRTKAAKARVERAKYELEEQRYRGEIDDDFDRRIKKLKS